MLLGGLAEMKVGEEVGDSIKGYYCGWGGFILIWFYGLEKHCHAYQLELEQMV